VDAHRHCRSASALLNTPYKRSIDACRDIWKNEGIAGFYRGTGISAVTYGIGSGLWWLTYEHTKTALAQYEGEKRVGWKGQAVAGFAAGLVATVFSNPFDVVKTRLQSHPGRVIAGVSTGELYKGARHGIQTMFREEGLAAFARGMPVRMIQRGPTAAISALFYEVIMRFGTTADDGSSPFAALWPTSRAPAEAGGVSRAGTLSTLSSPIVPAPATHTPASPGSDSPPAVARAASDDGRT